MSGLETNIFSITNLREMKARYRLYRIRGLALMGGVDQGFFFYRIAFITGTLLGLAEAARRLVASPRRPNLRARAGALVR